MSTHTHVRQIVNILHWLPFVSNFYGTCWSCIFHLPGSLLHSSFFLSSLTSPCSGNVTNVRFLPLMLHTYFTRRGHREPSERQIMFSSCCWCCLFIQEASEKSYQPLLKISHLSLFGVCSKGLPFFVEQRRWPHCSPTGDEKIGARWGWAEVFSLFLKNFVY